MAVVNVVFAIQPTEHLLQYIPFSCNFMNHVQKKLILYENVIRMCIQNANMVIQMHGALILLSLVLDAFQLLAQTKDTQIEIQRFYFSLWFWLKSGLYTCLYHILGQGPKVNLNSLFNHRWWGLEHVYTLLYSIQIGTVMCEWTLNCDSRNNPFLYRWVRPKRKRTAKRWMIHESK